MSLENKMMLYSKILPMLPSVKDFSNWLCKEQGQVTEQFDICPWADVAHAEVFDCRRLPDNFVEDTGAADREELWATKEPVLLPFDHCYFEFASMAIVATRVDFFVGENESYSRVQFSVVPVANYDPPVTIAGPMLVTWGEIANGTPIDWLDDDDPARTEPPQFCSTCSGVWTFDETETKACQARTLGAGLNHLIGVLALLRDKLVTRMTEPDEAPQLNKARHKRGLPPVSGARHVLRVNVPAVRRLARPLGGTHETPALHWRRGHWRVLHRGSEFEDRTWVRKCLVGDPDRGFVGKSYEVTMQLGAP